MCNPFTGRAGSTIGVSVPGADGCSFNPTATYDTNGNFRFSLIYANYLGHHRDWSTFRRFTYFVSKKFNNKTFLQQIGNGNFSSLEKIKESFSLAKVTKDFYNNFYPLFYFLKLL